MTGSTNGRQRAEKHNAHNALVNDYMKLSGESNPAYHSVNICYYEDGLRVCLLRMPHGSFHLGQGATQHEAWRDALRRAGNLGNRE